MCWKITKCYIYGKEKEGWEAGHLGAINNTISLVLRSPSTLSFSSDDLLGFCAVARPPRTCPWLLSAIPRLSMLLSVDGCSEPSACSLSLSEQLLGLRVLALATECYSQVVYAVKR